MLTASRGSTARAPSAAHHEALSRRGCVWRISLRSMDPAGRKATLASGSAADPVKALITFCPSVVYPLSRQTKEITMSADVWGIVGLIVAFGIGIPAFFIAKSIRSNKQKQSVDGGGSGYQAGGDIHINDKKK